MDDNVGFAAELIRATSLSLLPNYGMNHLESVELYRRATQQCRDAMLEALCSLDYPIGYSSKTNMRIAHALLLAGAQPAPRHLQMLTHDISYYLTSKVALKCLGLGNFRRGVLMGIGASQPDMSRSLWHHTVDLCRCYRAAALAADEWDEEADAAIAAWAEKETTN